MMAATRISALAGAALLLAALVLPLTGGGETDVSPYRELLRRELARHPLSQAEDIYKFAHQASFGSEHAVRDEEGARRWLQEEIAALPQRDGEELVEHLTPDRRLARVNLRPYLGAGHDPEKLLAAFIKTANGYDGSRQTFDLFWQAARELAREGSFCFTESRLDDLYSRMGALGFPALHHSREYEQEYRPAYRVVLLEYLELPAEPAR
jgi:hypothetical protein